MNKVEFHRGIGETLQKQALSFRGIPLTILPNGAKNTLAQAFHNPSEIMLQHRTPYQFRGSLAHEAFHFRPPVNVPLVGKVDLGQSETLARLVGLKAIASKPATSLAGLGDKAMALGRNVVDLATHGAVEMLPGLMPGTRYGGILGRLERLARMFPDVSRKLGLPV